MPVPPGSIIPSGVGRRWKIFEELVVCVGGNAAPVVDDAEDDAVARRGAFDADDRRPRKGGGT